MSGPGRLKKQATSMTLSQIPDIVKDLKAATYEGKEQVTHLMDIVALHQSQNPAALVQGGAIKPLVELLTNGNDGSQIHAASTLATIAAAKYEYQDKIIDAGGVEPLCHLLHQGSNKANCYAAAAVASLADQRKHQERIIKAGACRPLARLVREDVTVDTQWHASDAIADLSVQNPAAQKLFYEAGVVPLELALNSVDGSPSEVSFTFYPQPTIDRLSITGGPAEGGTVVTLHGSGFGAFGVVPRPLAWSLDGGYSQAERIVARCRFGEVEAPVIDLKVGQPTARVRTAGPCFAVLGMLDWVQCQANSAWNRTNR